MNSQWRAWAMEAMEAWNHRSAETGWSIEVVPFTKDRCQVFLLMQDISEKNYRGFRIDPVDVLEGQDERLDGYLNGMTVVLDTHLELTTSWMSEEDDTEDGTRDGWSTAEGEATLDPVDVLMHIFSQAMRVTHSSAHDPFLPDADVTDPRKPGEHLHVLSGEDVRRAAEAFSQQDAIHTEIVTSNRRTEFTVGNIEIGVPAYAFGRARRYNVSVAGYGDLAPLPLNVPSGMSHIISAFGIFTPTDIEEPLTITLTYRDEDLAARNDALGLAEGFYAPGLLEESLTVVRFDKQSWDLTPVEVEENPSRWEVVPGGELDTDANTVTFMIDEPGYYALSAHADPQQPSNHPGYLRVRGDRVQDEQAIQMALFYKSLSEAILRQLPAFVLGVLIGVLASKLFTRQKTLRVVAKEEGDGEGVADVK